MDGREIGSTRKQFVQRIAVVGGPRVHRIGDGGADDSDQHQLELPLRKTHMTCLGGHDRDETLTDLGRRQAMAHLHGRPFSDRVEPQSVEVPNHHVVVSPHPFGARCKCVQLGHRGHPVSRGPAVRGCPSGAVDGRIRSGGSGGRTAGRPARTSWTHRSDGTAPNRTDGGPRRAGQRIWKVRAHRSRVGSIPARRDIPNVV